MALLVLGALRTARSLKWGRGGKQSILNVEIYINVHVVLLTYIRILNHQQLSDRSACIYTMIVPSVILTLQQA